jgi:hypothetical protein
MCVLEPFLSALEGFHGEFAWAKRLCILRGYPFGQEKDEDRWYSLDEADQVNVYVHILQPA